MQTAQHRKGLRLHHHGYVTRNVNKAATMFERRFGYVRDSAVIHDPVQTAKVLFLRLPGDGRWLELVTPDTPESKLCKTLERRGEGWHHICFETMDIEGTGMVLRAERMLPVCEPVPASAFPGRRISWYMDGGGFLVELLEAGPGPLSLATIESNSGE